MPYSVQLSFTRGQAEAVIALLDMDLEDNPETAEREQLEAARRKVSKALDAVNARHPRRSADA